MEIGRGASGSWRNCYWAVKRAFRSITARDGGREPETVPLWGSVYSVLYMQSNGSQEEFGHTVLYNTSWCVKPSWFLLQVFKMLNNKESLDQIIVATPGLSSDPIALGKYKKRVEEM